MLVTRFGPCSFSEFDFPVIGGAEFNCSVPL